MNPHHLPQHEIVLMGIGHTNAQVLRMWRMAPIKDAGLTCVSSHPTATYSGMLPGVLAGQYPTDRMEIDLVRSCAAAGARLIVGHVTGLDRGARRLLFEDRPPLLFDVLSIGIGSVPQSDGVDRFDPMVVAIKPMQTLLSRLESRLDQAVRTGVTPVRIVIVGGGAGSVEVAFCLHARLRALLGHVPYHMTLVSGQDDLIGGVTSNTSAVARRELQVRGVELILGQRVTSVGAGCVVLDSGQELPAAVVVWATNAVGSPTLSKLGLSMDERGFLVTRPTLQSIDDDAIFAVGDTGTIDGQTTPKAGVYAVRQGPVLRENLGRILRGEELAEYWPQRGFLKLFNTGDGRAFGEYKGFSFFAHWAWILKDWIDSRFMDKFQAYEPPAMGADQPLRRGGIAARLFGGRNGAGNSQADGTPDSPLEAARCAGCGGKLSGAVLSRVLDKLDIAPNESVLLGLSDRDDAAILRAPASGMISLTVDFFAAPLNDPFLVGRIAALNAASDCYAMGARPLVALASAIVPLGPARSQEELLYELLAGALHEFRPMGATLAGGHTIEGSPLTFGFSMLAAQDGTPRTKNKLRAGDHLVVTKPLGIGILLAAQMQAKCRAAWWDPMLHAMLLSNQYAAGLCGRFGVQGLTDVTGFGLAGHLLEMLRASGLAAELWLGGIPLLPGVEELDRDRIESTLVPANRLAEREIEVAETQRDDTRYRVLFDPQTSGGLLMGVPEAHVKSLLAQLAQQSSVPAAVIGRVVEHDDSRKRLRVVR